MKQQYQQELQQVTSDIAVGFVKLFKFIVVAFCLIFTLAVMLCTGRVK